MIWLYVISISFALIWFIIFRYLAVEGYNSSEIKRVKITRGMLLVMIIGLLIPVINVIFVIVAPLCYVGELWVRNYDIMFKLRENDPFSNILKKYSTWMKQDAFEN